MYMLKNQITIEDRPLLEKYLNGFEYRSSGMSFTSLYMWREINQFSWEIIGDYLCIVGVSLLEEGKETPFLIPPMTSTGTYEPEKLRKTILEVRRRFQEAGADFTLRLLPAHMTEFVRAAFPEEIEIMADRPNDDYVYLRKNLAELSGRAYHGKKNHLNYFKNHYEYEYVPLTSAMAPQAEQFIREFNDRKQGLSSNERALLLGEERAMKDVFRNLERVGYLAGAILIDGKIEALSIGGQLGSDTVTVHVEKANTEFRGLYQAINNEFSKRISEKIQYINREEDMGIEGLRKAKLSYNPVKMIEKYIVIFKENIE